MAFLINDYSNGTALNGCIRNWSFFNDTTLLPAAADLEMAKTSDATGPVYAGTQVTYTLTVTNNGPSNASGVAVTDPLPADVAYVSDTCSGTYTGATHTWDWSIGALNATASGTCDLVVQVQAGAIGAIDNTASVTGTEPDPTPANNSSTASVTAVQSADLAVTKTSDATGTLYPGDVLTYTVTVANNGPDNATGVAATDVLPAEVAYVSDTCSGIYDGGTHTWTWSVGALSAAANTACDLVVEVQGGHGPIVNTVAVAGAEVDPTPANDSSTASVIASSQVPGIPLLGAGGVAVLVLLLALTAVMVIRRRAL